jgi:hypothetical protein
VYIFRGREGGREGGRGVGREGGWREGGRDGGSEGGGTPAPYPLSAHGVEDTFGSDALSRGQVHHSPVGEGLDAF